MSIDVSTLLDRALGSSLEERRHAFVELVRSKHWRLVLAPHVISCQSIGDRSAAQPDNVVFEEAAEAIASSETRVQRALELAAVRFGDAMLMPLARHMGSAFIEPTLSHLRTAEGERSITLQRALQVADLSWVKHPLATPVVRRQLRIQDQNRVVLIQWLSQAGVLHRYVGELRDYPPVALEEWGALGRSQIHDDFLFDLAMATLPHMPGPLVYLLRLKPVSKVVAQRVMASARGDWVSAALESTIIDGLEHELIIPLAEVAVRLGGRSLSTATAWIGAAKFSKRLLGMLEEVMEREGRERLNEVLWMERRMPSADRALEHGRRGLEPDLMDAAALVRQLRTDRAVELVREVLETPREAMVEAVLHPLCAVHEECAREVAYLGDSKVPQVAERAKRARRWEDVAWPPDDSTQEIEFD
ncbi:MAG: hypothetical protein JRH20_10040 [Deltaproteobacteria bacterium]|nr:hypothetical protein [Deltaproteobacteria bacterium]